LKISELIFDNLRECIYSEEFKYRYRLSQKAFTRKSVLNFSFLIIFILNLLKKSNAAEIDSSNTYLNKVKNFTKSALSKARLKLLPGTFIELNYILTTTFYQNNKKIKHFFGFIDFANIQISDFQLILER